MSTPVGQPLDALDTPQLAIDLDVVDANVRRMAKGCWEQGKQLRVHFKSLKSAGLARYVTDRLAAGCAEWQTESVALGKRGSRQAADLARDLAERGVGRFLCAKLNEAEVLVEAGLTDVFVANQVVGPLKLARLAGLARRGTIRVCVDDADNVAEMGRAARAAGATLEVLVEVDVGQNRCGVEPGEPVVTLARRVAAEEGLRFVGLQGYDGHVQMVADVAERRTRCLEGLDRLLATRRLLERAGLPVAVVTGAGTGTWEFAAGHEAITEIQPGSFILMDCAYHAVRLEFGCALTVLATAVSRRPGWYVLDAGSKAISKDFGTPVIKDRPSERVSKLSEEHTRVECDGDGPRVGERREVVPAHCCATMNLHRRCVAVRGGRVEAEWPIEASGRYD